MISSPLKIALISPESIGFAQTGGLANMVGSLGPALKRAGADPQYFLPKYPWISTVGFETYGEAWEVPIGEKIYTARFWLGKESHGIPLYLLDIPELFSRPGIYGEMGRDFPDNASRFIGFSRGILAGIKNTGQSFEVLHAHDWPAALIPFYLKTLYAEDPWFQKTGSILTIHNLSYQGIFPAEAFSLTGLEKKYFSPSFLEFYGRLNFLKGGILSADVLTTVSPSYAEEVFTPEFGCGLEGILLERRENFFGILNGIDTHRWNSATDPHLQVHYSEKQISKKIKGKEALQQELNLEVNREAPLLGMVNRLEFQKGIDLVISVIPDLVSRGVQFAVLGSGNRQLEAQLSELSRKFPRQVSVTITFHYPLSHRITAGSDFILMPSRFEPCGYNQLYGQRYGTVPIVRTTGGLKDTVFDILQDPAQGTGFCFKEPSAEALQAAILKALDLFHRPKEFSDLQRRIMGRDFSWDRSAAQYLDLYRKVVTAPRSPLGLKG